MIKQYLLDAATGSANAMPAKTKKKPTYTYKTLEVSGDAFVIEKAGARKTTLAVFIPLARQMYIKESDGTVSPMTSENLTVFCSHLTDDFIIMDEKGNQPTWIGHLQKGKKFAEQVLCLLDNDRFCELIRNDFVMFTYAEHLRGDMMFSWVNPANLTILKVLFEQLDRHGLREVGKKIVMECADSYYHYTYHTSYSDENYMDIKVKSCIEDLSNVTTYRKTLEPSTAGFFMDVYGLDGLRTMYQAFFGSDTMCLPDSDRIYKLFYGKISSTHGGLTIQNEKRILRLDTLLEYMFYESTVQGFADNIGNFMSSWADDLAIQEELYGEIKDKYPDNLLSHERILSYKYSQVKKVVDMEKWNIAAASMAPYEYKNETYSVVSPKTPGDMFEEARMQSNCLSSYVGRVINGECMIFFLRKNSFPDKSFVTIEVRDGELMQVKARFNKEPPVEAKAFVEKWFTKFFANTKAIA